MHIWERCCCLCGLMRMHVWALAHVCMYHSTTCSRFVCAWARQAYVWRASTALRYDGDGQSVVTYSRQNARAFHHTLTVYTGLQQHTHIHSMSTSIRVLIDKATPFIFWLARMLIGVRLVLYSNIVIWIHIHVPSLFSRNNNCRDVNVLLAQWLCSMYGRDCGGRHNDWVSPRCILLFVVNISICAICVEWY